MFDTLYLLVAKCHLLSAICYLLSAICFYQSSFTICYLFTLCYFRSSNSYLLFLLLLLLVLAMCNSCEQGCYCCNWYRFGSRCCLLRCECKWFSASVGDVIDRVLLHLLFASVVTGTFGPALCVCCKWGIGGDIAMTSTYSKQGTHHPTSKHHCVEHIEKVYFADHGINRTRTSRVFRTYDL